MKKVLLGTSALVAVGLCASEASAQGYATLGGFVREYFQVYDHHGSLSYNNAGNQAGAAVTNMRDLTLSSNSEFWVRGETKLNNGMIFGFRIEVEAWTQNGSTSAQSIDQIDEQWLYVKGSWGEIRLGEEDDARRLKAYSSYVSPRLSFGVDSPDGNYSLGTSGTYFNVENDAQKIIYFSPSFGGFSFAASYAPDAAHGSRNFALQGRNDCDGTQSRGCNGEAWSIAADYRGKFGDTTVGLDAGYTGSKNETAGRNDVAAWRADAFLQVAGWEASIQYGKISDGRANGLNDRAVGGALMYTMGPWTFGGFFQQGKSDIAGGGVNKLNHLAVAVGYELGGGVGVAASLSHQKRNNATGADPSATTLVFGIGGTF
jgi:predicted porin